MVLTSVARTMRRAPNEYPRRSGICGSIFLCRHPVLSSWEETWVGVLLFADLLAEIGIVCTIRIYSDGIGAVVELMNHPSLVHW